ncbi:MAG: PD-(D/E)XK nuclease domain-containing protein [Deltaproteobacteria bacterium]|nr:PD-(D/E)XK nuclease domain-containing protein [Deltaproteobacteria bacterium]
MNFDADQLSDAFTRILSWLTYFEQSEREGFHHAIIFAVLKSMSFKVTSQVVSPEGVIDFLIKTPKNTSFVGEFKYEKLEKDPKDDIETRRRDKLQKAIALGEAQIAKRRYYKGLFTKGATVKCLAVGIVGKNDVAAKIFDPPPTWFPLP